MPPELTELSGHGTKACTCKLVNSFVMGGGLFIFANLYLLAVTLWEGGLTDKTVLETNESPFSFLC